MSPYADPALSVVVVTRDRFETVRKLVESLRRQTAVDRLELVLVGPNETCWEGTEDHVGPFRHCQLLTCDRLRTRGQGAALGIANSKAPIVALTEDHSYPEPTWAERLIAAHAGRWTAVGASIRNANPRTAWSRVSHDLSYGRWTDPAPEGEIDDVPGFNSAFKRDDLLALGDDLARLLDRVVSLHESLRERGGRFYSDPGATLVHWNPSVRLDSVVLWFRNGRWFGAHRATRERWSLGRRLAYVAGTPLIPLMRLRALSRTLARAGSSRRETLGYYGVLTLVTVAIGLGEAYGYLLGEGDVVHILSDFEFRRDRYLASADRAVFLQ